MERVGDWVCLECNNLNFGFRDVCNRCDMDRVNVGKTIMSQHELDSIKSNPCNSKEQINILCDMALASATNMRNNTSFESHSFGSQNGGNIYQMNQQK